MEVVILVYFPNSDEEVSLIKFISKYQYLKIGDAQYFFSSNRYYRDRINSLMSKKFIRKLGGYFVLGEIGIEYAEHLNFEYTKLNRNEKYKKRLYILSNIGAFYHNCNIVKFIPSFSIKEKQIYTITGRRFMGILEINGFDYLTYYISKNHNNRYVNSVIYDIQKENTYKNIIIFVNDLQRINIDDFAFGINRVLIVENTDKEKLKYLHSIEWSKIINDVYGDKIYLSEYNFCDYTNYKNKYIATFYFLDTEKITRIKYFLRENNSKNIDIVCDKELEIELKKHFPKANYKIIDLDKYIIKERNIYD